MKACVLAYQNIKQSKPLYNELVDNMRNKFSSVLLVPIDKVVMSVSGKEISVKYREKNLEDFDVLLPRIGPSYIDYAYLVLKRLEGKVYFPNKPDSWLIARDKFHTLMKLSEAGIPVPKTIASISKTIAKNLSPILGPRQIIKQEGGSGGKGVVYSETNKSTNTILDALSLRRGEKLLLEEYIENPGEDVRLFVIGDKVHACAKRIANKKDIRSNIHAGGKYVSFDPDKKLREIAVKSAKIVGADICGVDVIFGDGKPYVIECNMNPGFFITKVTGVNIFKRITDYLYDNAKKFYSDENILSDVFADVIKFFKKRSNGK